MDLAKCLKAIQILTKAGLRSGDEELMFEMLQEIRALTDDGILANYG